MARHRLEKVHGLVVIAALCSTHAALHATEALHYTGAASTPDGTRKLYLEEHFVFDRAGQRTRLVLYRCPSGQPFARKWVYDVTSAEAPNFDLLDARSGYREGVSGKAGSREVYTQANQGAPRQSAPLQESANLVIDAGFDAFIRQHWDELSKRATIAFLVPSRLGTVNLKVTNISDDGTARHIRLSVDAWYGFAIPSIDLTYDAADRHLRQFDGLSNIRGMSGKNQSVRIDFPRSAEQAAPTPQDIERAANLPLTPHCSS